MLNFSWVNWLNIMEGHRKDPALVPLFTILLRLKINDISNFNFKTLVCNKFAIITAKYLLLQQDVSIFSVKNRSAEDFVVCQNCLLLLKLKI